MVKARELEEVLKKFTEAEFKSIETAVRMAAGDSRERTAFELDELKSVQADPATINATLLLAPLNKNKITLEKIEKQFGTEVKELEANAKKAGEIVFSGQDKNEALKKMLLSMSKDFRTVIVKLVEEAWELKQLKPENTNAKKIALEGFEVYSPLAHRLGMNKLKNWIEDFSFKILDSQSYKEISSKLAKKEEREKELEKLAELVETELKKEKIKATVQKRAKHVYGIYRKAKEKELKFEQVPDLRAIRIITEDKQDCYKALGIVHSLWKPVEGKFEDYIAKPKQNNYQSIHTIVEANDGKNLEVQIRTKEMHEIAEYGIASHWRYKGIESFKEFNERFSWLKQLLELRLDSERARKFLNSIKLELFENKIFVFTPKKQLIELPEGSTALDFAFAVHSQIGMKCQKALVNEKLVALHKKLESGDKVEIITSEKQNPKRSWLGFVKTQKAASKIRSALKIQKTSKKEEEKTIGMKASKKRSVKIAKCCKPVPGDEVLAFLTKKRKITIHRKDCKNCEKLAIENKVVNIEWGKSEKTYLVALKVIAVEKTTLLAQVLNELVKSKAIVQKANAREVQNKLTECEFEIEIKNLKQLENAVSKIAKIKGVKQVSRA